ncbi:MAG: recombinase A [Glaciecola sp.]
MNPILQELQNKQWVWTGANAKHTTPHQKLSTGFANLDAQLAGGFPRAGMIHINSILGCGEIRLMLSLFARHSQQQKLYVFIDAPFNVNAEFLAAHNIPLSQVIVIETTTHNHAIHVHAQPKGKINNTDALWSAEQCLKSGACEAVFIWQHKLSHNHIKKLELAAQHGASYCVWLQCHNGQAIGNTPTQHGNLPLSLSLSLNREKHDIHITINKQKVGWAHKSIRIPLPFKSQMNKRLGQYHSALNTHNVVAIHANNTLPLR